MMSEGESDQFSLRWNNFHSNLTSGFHTLLQGEELVDVTLAAGGQFVQAHKIVLSVCSPYFKDLFKVNPCKHPIVILKDVCHKDLVAILQFMYRGEVNVRQEELATFLKTAEMLQIKGLTGEDSPSEEESLPVPQHSVRTRAPRRISEKAPQSLRGTPDKKQPVTDSTNAEPEEVSAPPYKRMKPETSSARLSSPALTEESCGVEFVEMTNPKQEPVEYETEIEEVERLQNRDDPLVQLLAGESSQNLQDSSQGSSIFASIPSVSQDSGLPQDSGQERLYNTRDLRLYRPCNYCGKVMRRSSLRKHVIDRHMPNQAPVQCLYCPKMFRTANSLQNHHSIYHRNIGGKARQEVVMPLPGGGGSVDVTLYCACTFCGKMMRRSSLKRHIEDRHLPIRAVGCQYCSKVFRSNNSLQNHLSIYHRNAGRNRKLNKIPDETKLNATNSSST